jgi:uncharacterized protein (DUF1330 family)
VAAYLFNNIEVIDPVGYEEYKKAAPATIAAYGGRYLVRAGATEVLEGDCVPARVVILEFPSVSQLKSWYESPEYRPLRAIRHRTSRSTVFLLQGS